MVTLSLLTTYMFAGGKVVTSLEVNVTRVTFYIFYHLPT